MRLESFYNVNLKTLEQNIDKLKSISSKKIIFMIKSNAYGHGIEEIYTHCFKHLGIKEFGCASLGEARKVRQNFPDDQSRIIVFSDTNLQTYKTLYTNLNIIPVIHNMDDLNFFLSDSCFTDHPLFLKMNTGMNRMGIDPKQIDLIIEKVKGSGRDKIDHLLTHFSNSYIVIKKQDKTLRQYDKFLELKNKLQAEGIKVCESSVANSGAIEQGVGLEESHIRPGLMLYGPQSTLSADKLWTGRDIGTLVTRIIDVKKSTRGTPIGYGSPVLPRDGVVAHIPIGYGDGFLTYYSGVKLNFSQGGASVFGRVNMDLSALLFSRDANLSVGDDLALWGGESQNSIVDFSNQVKTNPYQIMCAVSVRVPRIYYK